VCGVEEEAEERSEAACLVSLRRICFPRSQRLREAADFRTVIKGGRSVEEKGILLYVREASERSQPRLGILASRRVVKRAVDRNRLKRVVREYFRLNNNRLLGGFDLVIRAIRYSKLLENKDLRQILSRLFRRSGILSCAR